MKITLQAGTAVNLVRGYAPGELRIGETTVRTSSLLSANTLSEWRPRTLNDVTLADFAPALALDPEILLLGSGSRQRFPDPAILADMLGRRIGFEVMDTPAACRTYNILVAEDRRVVAALLLNDD